MPEAPAGETDGPGAGEGCGPPPGSEDKVMHMSLHIGDTVVMGSDGNCAGAPSFSGFALSVTAPDPAGLPAVVFPADPGRAEPLPAGPLRAELLPAEPLPA